MSDNDSPGAVLEQTPGGYTVKYRDRYLYPRENPKAGTERKAGNLPLSSGTLYLVPSPLLFYGIEILQQNLPRDSHLLLAELDPALARLSMNALDNPELDLPRVFPPFFTSPESLEQAVDAMDMGKFRKAEILSITGGYALHSSVYRMLKDFLDSRIRTWWKNKATLIQMGRLWIRNLFQNLPLLPGSEPLHRLRTDRPVLVAGAGESLEGILDEIPSQRRNLFILAADTALPVLLDREILPDAVAALEGQHANLYDFMGLEGRRIPLLCDLTSSPALLHRYPGPLSFFLSRFAGIRLFEKLSLAGIEPPVLPPLGSVGIAALYLAAGLSSGPIFFAGLDFSFRPGKSHARSSPAHLRSLMSTGRIRGLPDFSHGFDPPVHRTEGKQGQSLLTTPNLLEYAGLLKSLTFQERIFDLGSSGLPLGFSSFPSLSEAVRTAGEVQESRSAGERFPEKEITRADRVKEFLEGEETDLSRLLDLGYRWLKGERRSGISEELLEWMKEKDYLSVSFPDSQDGSSVSESYLKRLLTHTAYYLERIRRAQTALGEN